MNENNSSQFYFNESRTKLITFILWLVIIPINIYFYRSGKYGQVDIDIVFLGREFFKSLKYDLPFVLILIGLTIKYVLDYKNKTKTQVPIRKLHYILDIISLTIFSLILMIVYFFYNPFGSIAIFLYVLATSYIIILNIVKELLKKPIKKEIII